MPLKKTKKTYAQKTPFGVLRISLTVYDHTVDEKESRVVDTITFRTRRKADYSPMTDLF